MLGTGQPRAHERRRPLPELKPYTQGFGKLNIAASNLHQLLKLANMGMVVESDELRQAAAKLALCADEMRAIIRDYSHGYQR